MEERDRLLRQAEETALVALKTRAAGNRKIADGHKLLARAIDIGEAPSRQTADWTHQGHMSIKQGHEMLARADEIIVEVREKIAALVVEAAS
jgi:hypothetical protein